MHIMSLSNLVNEDEAVDGNKAIGDNNDITDDVLGNNNKYIPDSAEYIQ